MTEKDRNIFLQTLYACLHTICGYLIIPISESNKVDLIKGHKWIKYYQYRPDTQKLYLQINVNKGEINNEMVKNFAEYKRKIDLLMHILGYTYNDFVISRADLCINSDMIGSYDRYRKLYKLIMCCLYYSLGLNRGYETRDPINFKHLNLKFCDRKMEIENYDKSMESQNRVPTKNRLELRSLKLFTDLEGVKNEFCMNWINRLQDCIREIKVVEERYNEQIIREYMKKDVKSVDALMDQYKNCIFSTRQLRNLLEKLQIKGDPYNSSKYYKRKYQMQFFSQKDIEVTISAITEQIKRYFNQ